MCTITMVKLRFVAIALVASMATLTLYAEPIRLQTETIWPEKGGARLFAAKAEEERAPYAVYLVQHDGKTTAVWRRSIREHGGRIYGYIPENAYLVGIASTNYAAFAAEVEHAYLGEFKPEHKCDAAAVEAKLADDAVFSVSLFEASERGAVAKTVRAVAGCEVLVEGGTSIRARLTREGIDALARLWAVHWIEPYFTPTVDNNVAVNENLMNVRPVWPGNETGLGLTGKGQTVGVCDGGLDTGNLETLHRDVRGRVTAMFDVCGDGNLADPNGHGTHVAGSVLGNGTESDGEIKGVAYEANLVF
ncbi:MAG: S8 family serine peptidase [Kiritimatiellae bacterium]|nr:S8 family serine peptidase [Kiritimatiellia bacterium]